MVVSTAVKSVPITPMRTPSPAGAQPFRMQVAASKVAKQASVVNALHRPRRQSSFLDDRIFDKPGDMSFARGGRREPVLGPPFLGC